MNLSNLFGIIPASAVDRDETTSNNNKDNSSGTLLVIVIGAVLVWGWLSPPLIVQFMVLVLLGVGHNAWTSDVADDLVASTTTRVSKDGVQEVDEGDFCHLKCRSNLFVSRFNFGMFGSI